MPWEILNHGGRWLLGQSRLGGGNGICPVGYSPAVGVSWGKAPCLRSYALPSVMLKILGEVQSKGFSNGDANVTYLNSLYSAALIDCSVSMANSRMVGLFLLLCTRGLLRWSHRKMAAGFFPVLSLLKQEIPSSGS